MARNYVFLTRDESTMNPAPDDLRTAKAFCESIIKELGLQSIRAKKTARVPD